MRKKLLQTGLTFAVSALLLTGAAAIGHGVISGMSLPVSAASENETNDGAFQTYGNFQYVMQEFPESEPGKEIFLYKYTGSEKNVVIPSTINGVEVTRIYKGCFSDCDKVETIYIPDTVSYIESEGDGEGTPFNGCKRLYKITVQSGNPAYYSDVNGNLMSGGETVYNPFENLMKTFSFSGRQWVGDNIYSSYTGSDTVAEIPNGITIVENIKYVNSDGDFTIEKVIIPETAGSIPISMNDRASGLCSLHACTDITIDKNNPNYSSYKGIVYNKDKTELILCPKGKAGKPALYSGVKKISKDAFYEAENITSISIPDSVTEIGECAFEGCRSLRTFKIPNGLTEIPTALFADCPALESINLPDSVVSIGFRAFELSNQDYYDDSIGNIESFVCPGHIKSIDQYAFAGRFRSVTVLSNVTSIGRNAFGFYMSKGGANIDGFVMYGNAGSEAERYAFSYTMNEYGGDYRFKFVCVDELPAEKLFKTESNSYGGLSITGYMGDTPDVVIPATINGKPVLVIESYSFWNHDEIETVTIPEGVTDLNRAFSIGCTGLKKITIPDSVSVITHPFTWDTTFTIYGYTGSVSEEYAVENDLPFVSLGQTTGINAELSADELVLGQSLTVRCSESVEANKQYKVSYKSSWGSEWTTVQEYSTNNVVTFKPDISGSVVVRIMRKTDNTAVRQRNYNINVCMPLENTTTFNSDTVKVGTKVTVYGNSYGGKGNKKFEIWYYSPSAKKWYRAKVGSDDVPMTSYDLETGRVASFTPKHAGTYTVRVKVKDETGTVKKKDFKLVVYAPLKNTSAVASTTVALGKSITVKTNSTGGLRTKLYEVWYYSPKTKKWSKTKSYSDITKASFKPKYTGTYSVRVKVKDERGVVVTKTMKVNVTA